jgi:copper transport protein
VVAAGGHGITGRYVTVGFPATVVHLGSVAVWLGGLVGLVLVVPAGLRVAAARRFSPLALGAVAALVLSGAVNTWRQVGEVDGLTATSYGKLVVAKVIVLLFVLAAAAESRNAARGRPAGRRASTVAPAAGAAPNPGFALDGATVAAQADRSLRWTLPIEVVGVLVALVVAALLVNEPPAREVAVGSETVTMVQGDRVALLSVEPAVKGGTSLHVTITSPRGSLDAADEITVTATLPDEDLGPIEIPTALSGPNHVTTDSAVFPVEGAWDVEVTARYGDFDQVVFRGQVDISG